MHNLDEDDEEFSPEFIAEARALRTRVHLQAGLGDPYAAPEPAALSARQLANRANAAHSTGPRTSEGKARSAGNSFKHGLYCREVVIRGEDPDQFEELRRSLRAEHQPLNTTEEILVNELAEQFWRIRRMRVLEAWAWNDHAHGEPVQPSFLSAVQRGMSAAERGFHRALSVLGKLQKQRGFVPAKSGDAAESAVPTPSEPAAAASQAPPVGFVPPNFPSPPPAARREACRAESSGPDRRDCAA